MNSLNTSDGAVARISEDAKHAVETGVQFIQSGDFLGAEPWFRRARRLAPADPVAAFLLASALSRDRPHDALDHLDELLKRYPSYRSAHVSRAAILYRLGRPKACQAVASLLGTMAAPTDDAFAVLAAHIAQAGGYCGWAGLTRCGTLVGNATKLSVSLDGQRFRRILGGKLPANWHTHRRLALRSSDGPVLGANFHVCSILAVEGFVAAAPDGAIQGWAYAPNDPDAKLEAAAYLDGHHTPVARAPVSDPIPPLPGSDGLMQAYGFRLALPSTEITARIHVRVGRHALRGSPLRSWPLILAERRRYQARRVQPLSGNGASRALTEKPIPPRSAVALVVTILSSQSNFDDCLLGLLAAGASGMRIVVVQDCEVDEQLQKRAAELGAGHIAILNHDGETGFPAAMNAALSSVAGCDVVLLDSGVIVPPGALLRLADAAYSGPSIGIVVPLDANGREATSIGAGRTECQPLRDAVAEMDQAAQRCPNAIVDLPTNFGRCVFLRHDCVADVGLFDDVAFAEGSCAIQDFFLRAGSKGWRHVAAGNVVVHAGSEACNPASHALSVQNRAILNRLHPGYNDLVETIRLADPLRPARFSLAGHMWAAGRRQEATILVTHADGGGVERCVRERAYAIDRAGGRAIVIQPADGYAVSQYGRAANRDLIFKTVDTLAEFLKADSPVAVEMHHLASHTAGLEKLGDLLGIPTDIFVHDFAAVCPQVTLCGRTGAYCGEPLQQHICVQCVEEIGTKFPMPGTVDAWRAAQAKLFSNARRVIAPSADAARRLRRYMPSCRVQVHPPEPEVEHRPIVQLLTLPTQEALRIAIVGALSVSKGFNVLLACARDAERRSLPIRYSVIGHTIDDRSLLDTGRAFVTGRFQEGEAQALLHESPAHIGFLPSVWPETWCYALSEMWQARLPVIAFDIGSQAARIRQTGAGKLLPLHTPAPAINDFFLSLRRANPPEG